LEATGCNETEQKTIDTTKREKETIQYDREKKSKAKQHGAQGTNRERDQENGKEVSVEVV